MVRLADGLDSNGEISEEAMNRAIECLTRFGQRLRDIPAANVRAVGTNTMRKASNSARFLKRAQKALNHSIEIISGTEEARMIFMGVSRALEDSHKRRAPAYQFWRSRQPQIEGRPVEPTHTTNVKVIGRQGRTARAIRTLLAAAGMKVHKRFVLEILE